MTINYNLILLGSSATLDGLHIYEPQEESTPEGSLITMTLEFGSAPTQAAVDEINAGCASAGVELWPGYAQVAYLNGNQIDFCWVKGMAWLPIILGVVVLTSLPALLGGVVWLLLPEEVKSMIDMLVAVLIMYLMMKFMMPMLTSGSSEKKTKRVEANE